MRIPIKSLKDGRSLPALGLGTWLMGGDMQKVVSAQNQKDGAAIGYAIENGFTHIDTAEIYADGYTEELVAEALQPFDRKKLFLASKAKQGNHTRERLSKALENSLRRLKTDYLDLYYLHRATPDTPLKETAEALNSAVAAGKVRHVGVCNFSAARLDKLQSFLDTKIFANQVHYNLAFRGPERAGLVRHAVEKDYFVVAWRPLRLINRHNTSSQLSHNLWDKGAFPIVDELAKKHRRTNSQIALAWLTGQTNVAALTKSSQSSRIDEILSGADFVLPPEDFERLTREFAPQFPVSDTIPLE